MYGLQDQVHQCPGSLTTVVSAFLQQNILLHLLAARHQFASEVPQEYSYLSVVGQTRGGLHIFSCLALWYHQHLTSNINVKFSGCVIQSRGIKSRGVVCCIMWIHSPEERIPLVNLSYSCCLEMSMLSALVTNGISWWGHEMKISHI